MFAVKPWESLGRAGGSESDGASAERSASLRRGRSTPPRKTEAWALGEPVCIHTEEKNCLLWKPGGP